jgi:hypothetical protein
VNVSLRAKRRLGLLLAMAAAVVLALVWSLRSPVASRSCDPWPEGASCAGYRLAYSGFGVASARQQGGSKSWVVRLRPAPATSPEVTHASLALRLGAVQDGSVLTTLRTVEQLRRPAPNPWETGWLLWRYSDDAHFYAVALKPNGWEISKQDPGYPGNQRFLATGSDPRYPVGRSYRVGVEMRGNAMTVVLPGRTVSLTDNERPYLSGQVGLYTEDADVEFRETSVSGAVSSIESLGASS